MRPKPLSFRPTSRELSSNRISQELMLVSFVRGHKEATNAWMVGWLEASLKLGLRRLQLSTDRSHGLLPTNRLAEKASKFQSNYFK